MRGEERREREYGIKKELNCDRKKKRAGSLSRTLLKSTRMTAYRLLIH